MKTQVVDDPRLSEEERLSHVVETIDKETCIVPKGAYVLTATSRVVPNVEYKGLSSLMAKKVSSYVLMQQPVEHKTLTKIKCRGAANTTDFLDGIANAEPKGVWTVQADSTGLVVTLRHLRWTGFEFHTAVGMPSYEGAYFGYGLENHDVALMV
uniref:Radial spoke head protein 9 homolog n=1 Tax=Lotharella globosa TaxID=91324 RepID=A0A7S3YD19_9EUKA